MMGAYQVSAWTIRDGPFGVKGLITILVSIFALSASASATNNYEYGINEYVTIAQGISPDGKWAITAHGQREYGYDDFHLYLTDARTGKNVAPLKEIVKILDTGAGSYAAKLSKDSSTVTIVWRWSRHDPFLSMTYRIKGRRAVPLTKAPVESDELGTYWSENCSGVKQSPRRFGTPKKMNSDAP
jgi:hypothetical protein